MPEPGTHVEFFNMPVLHGLDSKAAGREVFISKPHVKIRVAGNDKDIFVGPVNDQIKQRFPDEWAAFQRGEEVPLHGTPIERWPQLSVERVQNLKALGFRTVEDVAQAPDIALQKVGIGAYQLQTDARKFLSLAQSTADLHRLEELESKAAEKNALLRSQADQIKRLQEQMAEMMEKQAEKPKKRAKSEEAVE